MKKVARMIAMLLTAAVLLTSAAVYASAETSASDVVFVVDCSGSMRKEDRQYASKDIYLQFIESCDREKTSIGLVCFTNILESSSERLFALADEGELDKAREEADKIVYPVRDTDIALGLREAMRLLGEGTGEKKRIVFIGDGVTDLPNGPRTVEESERELRELIDRAREEGIAIYSIGMNGDGNANLSTIELLSDETGGMNYVMRGAGEAENVVSDILELMGSFVPVVNGDSNHNQHREKKSYSFIELYGPILQKFAVIEPTGTLQTIENSFSSALTSQQEVPEAVPEVPDEGILPETKDKNIIEKVMDSLNEVVKKLDFIHSATRDASEGDLSALDGMMNGEMPTDVPDVPEGDAPSGAPAAAPGMRSVSDYYLVLRSTDAVSGLKVFTNPEDKRADFQRPEAGISLYRLGNLGEDWNSKNVYIEFTGTEGSNVELFLMNADLINVAAEIESCVKPGETQNVRVYGVLAGDYSEALTELLDVDLSYIIEETDEGGAVSGEYAPEGFKAGITAENECHIALNVQAVIDDGIFELSRSVSMRYGVCERPVTQKTSGKQNMIFLSGLMGGTLLGKTIKIDDIADYDPAKLLRVQVYPATNITCEYDQGAGTVKLGGGNAFESNSFILEISDGYGTAKIQCESVTIPAMLLISILLIIVLIAAVIAMAIYSRSHTKFIGKLFLKFRLPDKMSDYVISDPELIFPYTSSISLWELIVLNSSMKDAMSQIIGSSELEAVAKGVTIESRSKGEIWLRIKPGAESLQINGEGFGKKKKKVVVLSPDDSASLEFNGEGGPVKMIVYRNPNTVKAEKVVFTDKKIAVSLDEKTENARQKLSQISEEAVDTVKNEKEDNIAVSFNECVNYYVFANILGMLKQDREGKHVRLYRDNVDFSPVTLVDSGIIGNDIYYMVFTKFCTNLDRQRRESLDSQMRALLDACAADDEKAKKTQKQAQSMIMSYTALLNMVQDSAMDAPGDEKQGKVMEFYTIVIDVCKQLLSKLDV